MKYFIITVDTEGDNLWAYNGGKITTNNSKYIPRFQNLCNDFNLKPVYLTNYEMVNDDYFVEYIKGVLKNNQCEVGMHLHAWNSPPFYKLEKKYDGNPFLVEYPEEIMELKIKNMLELLEKKIGTKIISHRAGRWIINDLYFKVLKKYGLKVDCSVTPFVDYSKTQGRTQFGIDYKKYKKDCSYIYDNILEVPMSIRKFRYFSQGSLKHRARVLLKGNNIWLRPALSTLEEMKKAINKIEKESDYLEFMIHSSELMPGGSPYFKEEKDIEKLYDSMKELFIYAIKKGYKGITLKDYYNIKKKGNKKA